MGKPSAEARTLQLPGLTAPTPAAAPKPTKKVVTATPGTLPGVPPSTDEAERADLLRRLEAAVQAKKVKGGELAKKVPTSTGGHFLLPNLRSALQGKKRKIDAKGKKALDKLLQAAGF
jgi:hypothetical protein